MLTILSGVCIFLIITLFLVMILLLAKKYLVHSGKVKITINNDTVVEADSGKALLSTLADEKHLPPFGLWRKRKLRTVQMSGLFRWRRHTSY